MFFRSIFGFCEAPQADVDAPWGQAEPGRADASYREHAMRDDDDEDNND